jgi:hypoxanthine phosphoribosyltransferase
VKETIRLLITEEDILARVDELAALIDDEYAGRQLTLICLLKGGVIFMADIAKRLRKAVVEMDFMDISSYGGSTVSKTIRINKDLENSVSGKNVLLVEDIIDTGKTLSLVIGHLSGQSPRSVKVCALLDKPDRREVFDVTPEYVGFTVPDEFVVGYGLDYDQRYRNLPYIGVLEFVD